MKPSRIAPIAAALTLAAGCATNPLETPPVLARYSALSPSAQPGEAMFPSASVSPITGRVLTRAEILASAPHAVLGDAAYAEVNSSWLPRFYDFFRATLQGDGILKSDPRSSDHLATYYAALAQARFYRETFHSFEKAGSLAIGTVWCARPDGSGHTLVVVLTERGRIFIEPQSGGEVRLAPSEQGSTFLEVF